MYHNVEDHPGKASGKVKRVQNNQSTKITSKGRPKATSVLKRTVKKEDAVFAHPAPWDGSKLAQLKKKNYPISAPVDKQSESTVQIRAGKQDILRRISAFQSWKREEINESNVKEFCVDSHRNQKKWKPAGCARVDAVLIKRSDCKSHIKVHRVVNEWGPQTCGIDPGSLPISSSNHVTDPLKPISNIQMEEASTSDRCPSPINKRLSTVEFHLDLGSPVPQDIYSRIKRIEERILKLEAVSPEYYTGPSSGIKLENGIKKEEVLPTTKKVYSRNDLESRLAALKSVKKKVKKRKGATSKKMKLKERRKKIKV